MPKYFGENNPDISYALLVDILTYADNRVLTLISSQISKNWLLITSSKPFRQNLLHSVLKRIHLIDPNNIKGGIELISSGYTNENYKISKGNEYYVLRIPIMKNHPLINRYHEEYNTSIAYELGLGAGLMFYEKSTGIMVTQYIHKKCLTNAQLNDKHILNLIATKLNGLHNASQNFLGDWLIFNKITELYRFIIGNHSPHHTEILKQLMDATALIRDAVEKLNIKLCPCHNDLSPNNLLCESDDINIIDWEFSGNNDPIWDLAFLSVVSELSFEHENLLLLSYFSREPAKADYYRLLVYKPIVHFWIGMLSLLQIYNCNERLGKKWLTEIVENKFIQAKNLFVQSRELINKLMPNPDTEVPISGNMSQPVSEPSIASPLFFGMQDIHIQAQELNTQNQLDQKPALNKTSNTTPKLQ